MDNSIIHLLNGDHELSREMKKYIATPWCNCNGEYKSCMECKPPLKKINDQGIQAHGGDLFQHSQWSALYLFNWFKNKKSPYNKLHKLLVAIIDSRLLNAIISTDEDIKLGFLLLCGFMHDICKGGDGIYDMYAKNKYGKKLTDADHPAACKQTLIEPGNRYNGMLKTTLNAILANYVNKPKALAIMALCAAVHWNFGKLNIPKERGGWTPQQYLDSIHKEKLDIEKRLNIKLIDTENVLIKLCMAIGASDVASSYNDELHSRFLPKGVRLAQKTHLSNGASWTQHKFNKNHKKYITLVLKRKQKAQKRTRKK
jgi:hypothetical protein